MRLVTISRVICAIFCCIALGGVLATRAQAATNLDLATPANFSIRVDGALGGDTLSRYMIGVADIDGNGKNDLIVGAPQADNNSRGNSGSLYVIFDALLDDYSGTGNTIDLGNTSTYNVRIDGPAASGFLGFDEAFTLGDIDGDGKAEVVVSAPFVDANSRTDSGSLYIISGSLLAGYTTTGNTHDLASSSSYRVRYDGGGISHTIGEGTTRLADIDNDGELDLLFSTQASDFNSRDDSGSVYVLYNDLLTAHTGTGNTVDMASTSQYNLRFDGADINHNLGFAGSEIGDFNSDGLPDIILAAYGTGYNNRATSSSIYLVDHSIFASETGTENLFDLNVGTSYTARFDGATASDQLGILSVTLGDLDGNGRADLSMGAFTDYNNRTNSGSVYILYDIVLSSLSGTGNTVDMAVSTNFTARIDGAVAGHAIGLWSGLKDFTADGRADLIIPASSASYNNRATSGSLYILDNSLLNSFSGTGNLVDLANEGSYTTRYDGAAASERFGNGGNTFGDLNNDGGMDLLVAAYTAGYNSRANSGSVYIFFGPTPPESPASSPTPSPVAATPPPPPVIPAQQGGILTNDKVVTVVEKGTFAWDSYLAVQKEASFVATIVKDNLWQATPVQEIWYKSVFNDAKVVAPLKPYIMAIKYKPEDLDPSLPEANLKVAYSTDKKNWRVLPHSVLDLTNKTVSVLTKQGGYYMLVSGYETPQSTQVSDFVSENSNLQIVSSLRSQPTPSQSPSLTPSPTAQPASELDSSKRCIWRFCW